jgi:hypothetical protein
MTVAPPVYSLFAGDWNFVVDPTDSSSSSFTNPTSSFLKTWFDFLAHFGLREIVQPLHTYYHICEDPTKTVTRRLDRIYVSHSEIDLALNPAQTAYVHLPNSIVPDLRGRSYLLSPAQRTPALPVSDHIAVGLSFARGKLVFRSGKRIQRWLAKEPLFRTLFGELLSVCIVAEDSPFAKHRAFIKAAFEAKRLYFVHRTDSKTEELSRLAKFGVCLQALRLLSKGSPDSEAINALLAAHPFVRPLIVHAEEGTIVSELRSYANELIAEEAFTSGATHADFFKHPLTPQARTLQDIKTVLPSDRVKLAGLRRNLDEEITQEPQAMAEIAAEYWGPVWRKRDKDPHSTKNYLKGYHKRISGDLRRWPCKPDTLAFIDIINDTNNSCAGPDGIPFAVYRAATETYAGIAAGIFDALADGTVPPEGFNDGLLFLLPKKGLLVPDDTRPLSVTNAYNRIIASGVVSTLVPTLQDFLEASQKGFIPGRTGNDHVISLNDLFYRAVNSDDPEVNFFVMFVDTKKAFDSIDHDYILALLKKIGLPGWLVSLVTALLRG